MALKDFEKDMMRDSRCGYCKVIPHVMMTDTRFINVCPSIAKFNFHGFSAGGRMVAGLSLLRDRIEYTDGFLDMIYQCQMDGACDVSCKIDRDLEPLQVMQELRIKCVEDGQLIAGHMPVLEGLRKEDNMLQRKKADRGKWAEGLGVKEVTKDKAEVLFHAGCRYSFDNELWPIVQNSINILKKAGMDVGIMGKDEACCGGRAYEMGYEAELVKYAEHNIQAWKTAGVKTVVTPCSCCYQTFKVLYDKIGKKPDIEIYHFTEYLDKLIKEGKLKFTKKVPMTVTYHDPCHLGRLSEPWIHWNGKEVKVAGQMIVHDPPKKYRRGGEGVYDIPRDILKAIPGLNLVEMYRIREYAWCCGSGGGVKEAYPEFALWTAGERIKEAKDVGAEALVSACGWCKRNFTDAVKETGNKIEVLDIIDLVQKAL
jgi:Fe-S oxidoreductase